MACLHLLTKRFAKALRYHSSVFILAIFKYILPITNIINIAILALTI